MLIQNTLEFAKKTQIPRSKPAVPPSEISILVLSILTMLVHIPFILLDILNVRSDTNYGLWILLVLAGPLYGMINSGIICGSFYSKETWTSFHLYIEISLFINLILYSTLQLVLIFLSPDHPHYSLLSAQLILSMGPVFYLHLAYLCLYSKDGGGYAGVRIAILVLACVEFVFLCAAAVFFGWAMVGVYDNPLGFDWSLLAFLALCVLDLPFGGSWDCVVVVVSVWQQEFWKGNKALVVKDVVGRAVLVSVFVLAFPYTKYFSKWVVIGISFECLVYFGMICLFLNQTVENSKKKFRKY